MVALKTCYWVLYVNYGFSFMKDVWTGWWSWNRPSNEVHTVHEKSWFLMSGQIKVWFYYLIDSKHSKVHENYAKVGFKYHHLGWVGNLGTCNDFFWHSSIKMYIFVSFFHATFYCIEVLVRTYLQLVFLIWQQMGIQWIFWRNPISNSSR